MSNVKAALHAALVTALVYLRDNPGAVSFIVGEGVLLAAKVGLHVTAAQLGAVVAVTLPLLLGYFHLAKKAQVKAAPKPDEPAGMSHD